MEWHIHQHAKACDQHSLMLLRTVPGIGEILSLVILYEIHTIERFPSVQHFVSYCRLVKCKKESAGNSYGTTGHKIGNAYLKWAFSEAAVLFLRKNSEAQAWLERMANKHNKACTLTILAHSWDGPSTLCFNPKQCSINRNFLTINGRNAGSSSSNWRRYAKAPVDCDFCSLDYPTPSIRVV